jgi:hypothetical protein
VNDVVSLGGFVTPGMKVDVVVMGAAPGAMNAQGHMSKTILQNIQVLSAGQKRRVLLTRLLTRPAVLASHAACLRGEPAGTKANLSRADLSRANLSGADLGGADLSRADLRRADLSGANLSGANLGGADLGGADLSGADLSGADLSGANLGGADLSRANLSGANLSGANLRRANLGGADLSRAVDGHVARLDFGGWSICVRSVATSIGCQSHANESWLSWSPESPEIIAMHVDAAEWWRVHGDAIKAVICFVI